MPSRHVFDEEQLAARLQHAMNLGKSELGICDGAQYEHATDDIETLVVEGQLLGGRSYRLDMGYFGRQTSTHMQIRLAKDQPRNGFRHVWHIGPRPGT